MKQLNTVYKVVLKIQLLICKLCMKIRNYPYQSIVWQLTALNKRYLDCVLNSGQACEVINIPSQYQCWYFCEAHVELRAMQNSVYVEVNFLLINIHVVLSDINFSCSCKLSLLNTIMNQPRGTENYLKVRKSTKSTKNQKSKNMGR